MDAPLEQLTRWRDAGLLTDEQVEAIVSYERSRAATQDDAGRRPVVVEAIGYVGGALAVGAIALMLGDVWDELVPAARLGLLVLFTVLLGAAGLVLRSSPQPPLARLSSALLVATVGGVAWSVTTLTFDLAGWSDRDVALAATSSAAATALAFYLTARRALVQVALLLTVAAWIGALLFRPALAPEGIWVGLVFWAFGIAWLLLGRGGWLPPPQPAEVFGGIVALLAMQATGYGDHGTLALGLAVATAVALVVLAVAVEQLHHLVVGAVGLFVLVPQLVFDIFGDAIGAPATLLVVGLLLVLLAVGLGRARRVVREEDV